MQKNYFKYGVLLLFLLSTVLIAVESKSGNIIAKEAKAVDGTIVAKGDALLKYGYYTVFGDYIKYDKNSGSAKLEGNVYFFEKDLRVVRGEKANFNLKERVGNFENSFIYEYNDHIWLRTSKLEVNKNLYKLENGSFSSCDVKDPAWKITFKKGSYSNDDKGSLVKIENAIFYANSTPIFYLPFYQFATKRTTGLLTPRIGTIENEGFFYSQPIYYAPSINWDFETRPQIRTLRGRGIFNSFRFVDSPNSEGQIEFGTFREKSSYADEYSLVNKDHYGVEVDYNSTRVFSSGNHKDGLFMDIALFNDTEYINTQSNKTLIDKVVTSKINYYYDTNRDYYGIYGKYFLDTTKDSNQETIQSLPTLQYHKFSNSFLVDNLLYSFDVKGKNYYRSKGLNANQLELNLPIIFHFNLFNDYMNFYVSQNLYSTFVDYTKNSDSTENGRYLNNYFVAGLSMDLSKKYDTFFHTINTNFYYTHPQYSKKEGYFADFINTSSEEESLNAKFSQYFFDKNGLEFLSHSITQPYYFNNSEYRYGNLEHEVIIRPTNKIRLSNNFTFSHKDLSFTDVETTVEYNPKLFNSSLSHTYQQSNSTIPNYISAKMETKFNSRYNFFVKADYNSKYDIFKLFEAGYKMKKKCWEYSFTYKEETTPTLSETGTSSFTKKGIFFNIKLKPVGQLKLRAQKEKFKR